MSVVIHDFTLEPRPLPAPAADRTATPPAAPREASTSPGAAREIERLLRRNRHRAARLWSY